MTEQLSSWNWRYYTSVYRAEMPFEELGLFFRRVLFKRDLLIVVVGKKGAGKSFTSASLCEAIDPDFCREDVVHDLPQFYKRFEEKSNSGKKYGTLVMDDFGSESDQYSFASDAAKSLSFLFQKSRTFHLACFLSVPNAAFININMRSRLPDYRIELLGHNPVKGYSVCRILRLSTDPRTGYTFNKHLFAFGDGSFRTKFHEGQAKVITHCIPSPSQSFIDWYVPYREQLARDQLGKSILMSQGRGKPRILAVIEGIKANPKAYVKVYNKNQLTWNKDLIGLEFDLKDSEVKRACAALGSPPPLQESL